MKLSPVLYVSQWNSDGHGSWSAAAGGFHLLLFWADWPAVAGGNLSRELIGSGLSRRSRPRRVWRSPLPFSKKLDQKAFLPFCQPLSWSHQQNSLHFSIENEIFYSKKGRGLQYIFLICHICKLAKAVFIPFMKITGSHYIPLWQNKAKIRAMCSE